MEDHFLKDLINFYKGFITGSADSVKVLAEIEEKYPETANSYIKTTKTLKKSTIKKALEDGVIELAGATTKPQDKKFEYKYTGVK